jgi:hypothetical protein
MADKTRLIAEALRLDLASRALQSRHCCHCERSASCHCERSASCHCERSEAISSHRRRNSQRHEIASSLRSSQ